MPIMLSRGPRSDEELYELVKALWGICIPRNKTCSDHDAPFDAFAAAYFRRSPSILIHGSRGLSGKSRLMSILGLTVASVLGSDVNIVGGSLNQSINIHNTMRNAWESDHAPRYLIREETATRIKLTNQATIMPLTASQKTVRGPHPPSLLLDEIDEMDLAIFDASLGQPMPQENWRGETIRPMTVMTSTWQYPDRCQVEGSLITTERGQVPIQGIRLGERVLTRQGWREVLDVVFCGRRPYVEVEFASGTILRCSGNHRIWTNLGWIEAAALTPCSVVGVHMLPMCLPVSSSSLAAAFPTQHGSVGDHGTGQSQIMPVVADRLGSLGFEGSQIVDPGGDGLQVTGIDAQPDPAQMVQWQVVGDGSVDLLVDPAVGEDDGPDATFSDGLVPVPGDLIGSQRPEDALVGIQIEDVVPQVDQVVSVRHSRMLLPMWDLTVDGTPEYVAEGVVVHNTFAEVQRRFEEREEHIFRWCYKRHL